MYCEVRQEGDSAIYVNPTMTFIKHSVFTSPVLRFSENTDNEKQLFNSTMKWHMKD